MNKQEFSRVVSTFADTPGDIDWTANRLLVQIRDDVIEAELTVDQGDLFVCEPQGSPIRAYDWIVRRVARIEQLAQRILDYIPEEPYFVVPTGDYLDNLDEDPTETEQDSPNVISTLDETLSRQPAGISSVVYLTSDAGEGKTTTINNLARVKANQYQKHETSWLAIPIALGGRPFMRLDDIVVAEMSNRYRFPIYFQAFLELVKLNVIVPALDGFEEVFEERSSGEGASSLGRVLSELDGSGRLIVAARKAYFEIKSFAAQAKLYDSFGAEDGVDFSRMSLKRWTKDQFVQYASKRSLSDGSSLYESVANRLGADHPMLTRAVLAGRLVEVADEGDISALLDQLGQHPDDYFFHFVNTIVEREATTKWVYRSGSSDSSAPLLTVEEHHDLLTGVAREMWISGTDALKDEIVTLVAEVFSDEREKSPEDGRQIQERIHQHSLLVSAGPQRREITFDHEDFRLFYLGQALARDLSSDEPGLEGFMRAALLPGRSIDAAVHRLYREGQDLAAIADRVKSIGESHPKTSYVNVNAANIFVSLRSQLAEFTDSKVRNLSFSSDSLKNKRLSGIEFESCYFSPTSTADSTYQSLVFRRCEFERLELDDGQIHDCRFEESTVVSVVVLSNESTDQLFEPQQINNALVSAGFAIDADTPQEDVAQQERNAVIAGNALRAFMRSTHINENVFKQKMGQDAHDFFTDVLPRLVGAGIVREVPYKGAGRQSRYKLNIPMRRIEGALLSAKSLDELVQDLGG